MRLPGGPAALIGKKYDGFLLIKNYIQCNDDARNHQPVKEGQSDARLVWVMDDEGKAGHCLLNFLYNNR